MKFDPFFLIFLVIGVALTLGGLYNAWRTRQFLASAEETDGTVIGLKEVNDSDGTMYAPVVRFHASNGSRVEFTDPISSRPSRHQIGQSVRVAYDPEEPDKARVSGTWFVYFVPMAMLAIGIVFTVIGAKGTGVDVWNVARDVTSPTRSHVGPFGGQWVNENPAASGITRIDIASKWPVVQIKAWGKCHPVDCDWGAPETYDNSFIARGELYVTWRTNFADRRQRMTVLPDGRLQVETHTHFTDLSRRVDYDGTEIFRRQ